MVAHAVEFEPVCSLQIGHMQGDFAKIQGDANHHLLKSIDFQKFGWGLPTRGAERL